MLSLGIPRQAVVQKMKMDGIDPNGIDKKRQSTTNLDPAYEKYRKVCRFWTLFTYT